MLSQNQPDNITPPVVPSAPSKSRGLFRGLRKWGFRLIFLLLFLFVALYFLIGLPAVQNFLLPHVTEWLSKELKTEVSVGKIGIRFFDNVVLEDVLMRDQRMDTLGYVSYLEANVSFFSLLDRQVVVEDIRLDGAHIHFTRYRGDRHYNIRFLQEAFKGDPNKPKRSNTPSFLVGLQSVYLSDIHFNRLDSLAGDDLSIYLDCGDIHFDTFALHEQLIDVRVLNIASPVVDLQRFERFPLPKVAEDSGGNSSEKKVDEGKGFTIRVAQSYINDGRFT